MLDRCPLCGSPLECRDGGLTVWCCSPECGACFHDINTTGLARTADPATSDRAAERDRGAANPAHPK